MSSLIKPLIYNPAVRFFFGNPFGWTQETKKSRRIIFVNPEFYPSLLTRICDRNQDLNDRSSSFGISVMSLVGKTNSRIGRLSNYLISIKSNGDLNKIREVWDKVKPNFTEILYRGLREGREDFYIGIDVKTREEIVKRFKQQGIKYTKEELQTFLDSVTNYISTSLEQMDRFHLWSLGHILVRHIAGGIRHSRTPRNVISAFIPTIRHSIVLSVKEEYIRCGGSWSDNDQKMWDTLFDNVWESMTLMASNLSKGHWRWQETNNQRSNQAAILDSISRI